MPVKRTGKFSFQFSFFLYFHIEIFNHAFMKLITLIISVLICNVSIAQITCNNWLKVPQALSGVTIGDLDVSGNKMTI
jgi:hypothetical protein